MFGLNKKNYDGSVNSYQETGIKGHGYTVPFNHPKFKEQIEDGIWEVVFHLNASGYKTITSCEGHWIWSKGIRWNTTPQVTVVGKIDINTFFVKSVQNETMDGDYTSIRFRFERLHYIIPFSFMRKCILQAVRNTL